MHKPRMFAPIKVEQMLALTGTTAINSLRNDIPSDIGCLVWKKKEFCSDQRLLNVDAPSQNIYVHGQKFLEFAIGQAVRHVPCPDEHREALMGIFRLTKSLEASLASCETVQTYRKNGEVASEMAKTLSEVAKESKTAEAVLAVAGAFNDAKTKKALDACTYKELVVNEDAVSKAFTGGYEPNTGLVRGVAMPAVKNIALKKGHRAAMEFAVKLEELARDSGFSGIGEDARTSATRLRDAKDSIMILAGGFF